VCVYVCIDLEQANRRIDELENEMGRTQETSQTQETARSFSTTSDHLSEQTTMMSQQNHGEDQVETSLTYDVKEKVENTITTLVPAAQQPEAAQSAWANEGGLAEQTEKAYARANGGGVVRGHAQVQAQQLECENRLYSEHPGPAVSAPFSQTAMTIAGRGGLENFMGQTAGGVARESSGVMMV
jgi:hypothetical protein